MEVKNKELLECAGLQIVQTGDGIAVEHISKQWPQAGDEVYYAIIYGYDLKAETVKNYYKGEGYQDSMIERGLMFQHKWEAEELVKALNAVLKPVVERQEKGGMV